MPICVKGACACTKKEHSSSDGAARVESEPAHVQDQLVAKCKKLWSERINGESVPIPLDDEAKNDLYNVCCTANGGFILRKAREEMLAELVQLAEKHDTPAVTVRDVISCVQNLGPDTKPSSYVPRSADVVREQQEEQRQEANEQTVQDVKQLILELFPSKINGKQLNETKYEDRKAYREQKAQQAEDAQDQQFIEAEDEYTVTDNTLTALMDMCTTYSIKFQNIVYQTKLLTTKEGLEPPKFTYRVGYRPLDIPGGKGIQYLLELDHALIQLDDVVFEILKGENGNADYHVYRFEEFETTDDFDKIHWDAFLGTQETYMPPQVLDDILGTSGQWKDTYNWRKKNCHHFVTACLQIIGTPWQFNDNKWCCVHKATPAAGEYSVQMPDGTTKSAADLDYSVWLEIPGQPIVVTFE